MVNLKINNIPVSVPEGTTILEAARTIGIRIPTLCYLKEINAIGACRVCVVEVKGARSMVTACVYPVSEGMEVTTNSEKVKKARKTTLELLLSTHKQDCLSCSRNLKCELQELSKEYGCDSHAFDGEKMSYEKDNSTPYLVRDDEKCILCRRCVATCAKVQETGVIGVNNRGFNSHVACAFDSDLTESPCVACGQCINVCPTGALHEVEEIDNVKNALADPEKVVIVAPAPAVRVALGEEFGMPFGTNVEGQMITALRALGFDKVFDVNFGADMTIMEEATELIERIKNGGTLPMITSCSPGWVRYLEYYYPDCIPNLSTCKSPQQMTGALVKTYYAEKAGIDPKNIYMVSVMPCVAKKTEKLRPHMDAAGVPDIDAVLTTRELAKMIKESGLIFPELKGGEYDNPMGEFTGAGVIFGVTGGVMEAALRSAVYMLTGKNPENPDFTDVRGMDGIKEATYKVGGKKVRIAVASGLNNAKKICEDIKNGVSKYDFIEIMCCPGGCINGGGQPIVPEYVKRDVDYKTLRANALYGEDERKTIRYSHENPAVKDCYANYLGNVGAEKAHHILHTEYFKRKKYPNS